jgi:hypothetical protein
MAIIAIIYMTTSFTCKKISHLGPIRRSKRIVILEQGKLFIEWLVRAEALLRRLVVSNLILILSELAPERRLLFQSLLVPFFVLPC